MNDKQKPSIRFKGFTEAWEQRKVRDVADRFDNLRIPVAANLRVPGATPYYGANGIQDYVEGFTHDGEFVLVAEDGANDLKNYPVKCVKGRIWVNNHAHVLQGKQNIADNQFLAFSINRADIESLLVGGGRAKLNAETMMDISLSMPNIEEQRIIGQYISTVDNLITLHQRKYDKLVNVKKSMLEKMFPRDGKNVPEIRFSGFTEAWEQRKLGELLSFLKDGTHGTHADVDDGPLLLSAKNIKNGGIYWDETDRRISYGEYEKIHSNFSLESGDVLLTIVGSIGETAILKDSEGITFQRSVAFLRPNNKITPDFLYSEIQTPTFQKELDSRKSTSAQPGIYLGDLAEIPLIFSTKIDEQKKIGEYFSNFDNLITLHQREVEKLQNIKKSCLEKMFV